MAKKCFYCSCDIGSNTVVDMCANCMHQVWGEKMTNTIISNMERERDSGNLELGRVSEFSEKEKSNEEASKSNNDNEIHPLEKDPSLIENETQSVDHNVPDSVEEVSPSEIEITPQENKPSNMGEVAEIPRYENEAPLPENNSPQATAHILESPPHEHDHHKPEHSKPQVYNFENNTNNSHETKIEKNTEENKIEDIPNFEESKNFIEQENKPINKNLLSSESNIL